MTDTTTDLERAFERFAFRNLYSRELSSLPSRKYTSDLTEHAWRGFVAGVEVGRSIKKHLTSENPPV